MKKRIRINESQLRKIVAKSVNTILNEMVIDPDMWENPEKYWERIKQHEYEKGPKNWNWIKCQDPVFKRLDLEWIPSEEYEDGIYRDADYHEYYKDGRDLISIEDPESFEDDFDDNDELYESVIKRAVSESVRKVLKEHDPHNIPGKFCIYNHHIGTHGVSYGLLGPNKEYFVYDPTKLNTIFCTSQEEAAQKADEINRKLDQEESMSRKRFDDMNSLQEGWDDKKLDYYGKKSVRNKRFCDSEECVDDSLAAARQMLHKQRRGVKTKGSTKARDFARKQAENGNPIIKYKKNPDEWIDNYLDSVVK